jgi:hypothetical protein
MAELVWHRAAVQEAQVAELSRKREEEREVA